MPGPADNCQVCGTIFGYSLNRCPACHRTFCESCSVRRGGCAFCGVGCAHAFFFGDADEETETSESQAEE